MSRYRRVLAMWLLCFFAVDGAWADGRSMPWGDGDRRFLDAAQVFRLDAVRQQDGAYSVRAHVADGYYVYRHSIRLLDRQGDEIRVELPAGTPRHDEFFGDTQIYEGDAPSLRFPVSASGPLTLHWQGCAKAGICYPPATLNVDLPATVQRGSAPTGVSPPTRDAAVDSSPARTDAAAGLAEDQAAAQRLATLGPIAGMLLFFGFGLLLAFTPCSLPMIPIVSTIVVGSRAGPRRALFLSSAYVLAMAGTYASVGAAAGLAGANLQAALQSPWLLGAFAALFVILAASLFGLFELRLPSALVDRVGAAGGNRPGGSIAGSAALGFLSALLVGPCMTAPLAGALLYIGQTGSALQGGLALFALGIGMGLPLLAIAVFGAGILPRPGAWMNRVRIAFGYVMAGMAVMMLARLLPGTASLVLWGAWILSVALGLLAWSQALAARPRPAWALRSGAAFAALWSVLMLIGAASGGESAWQPLAHLRAASAATTATPGVAFMRAKSVDDVDGHLARAASRGQWTLIDFYADWCVSCHVIEREVFGDPAVAARLASMQVLRPDVTSNDRTDKALLERWGVMGPPTLILVGPDGVERRALRVVGEIDARGFLSRLESAGAS
ncbi:MAG: protein-disulfide reductase DsbD [Burkholderiaceae bacterium]